MYIYIYVCIYISMSSCSLVWFWVRSVGSSTITNLACKVCTIARRSNERCEWIACPHSLRLLAVEWMKHGVVTKVHRSPGFDASHPKSWKFLKKIGVICTIHAKNNGYDGCKRCKWLWYLYSFHMFPYGSYNHSLNNRESLRSCRMTRMTGVE